MDILQQRSLGQTLFLRGGRGGGVEREGGILSCVSMRVIHDGTD